MSTAYAPSAAPYAPPNSVLQVITRFRDRGLPLPVNKPNLEMIRIPSSSAVRTLHTLRFLGLIDEDGQPTERFERLKRAPNGEYKTLLAEVVRDAYQSVFTFADPAQDDVDAVNDAFRQFEPSTQRDRMVNLFLALCAEAGIVPPESRPKVSAGRQPRSSVVTKRRSQDRYVAERMPAPKMEELPIESAEVPRREREVEDAHPDYRLISVLLQQLPKDKRWTKRQRDRWLQAMTANVDLLLEIIDEPEQAEHKAKLPQTAPLPFGDPSRY